MKFRIFSLILLFVIGVLATIGYAIDKVTLKNGSVVEGTILREAAGVVWIKDATGKERMLLPSEVASVVRGVTDSSVKKDPQPTSDSGDVKSPGTTTQSTSSGNDGTAAAPAAGVIAASKSGKNKVKAIVLTLGERGDRNMVGKYMTQHALLEALPMLEEELGTDGSGIVVLRCTSGGGALLEIQRLSDVIHNEYKKRFKVVGWIDSAISAAAMTMHTVEDIYFTSQGNYGACTGFSGAYVAVKGYELLEVIEMMKKISARGNHDPKIMESMQVLKPLSAKVDGDNVVFFHDAVSGDILVNPEDRILTLNAKTAEKIRFSRGTADTLDELTRAMGYEVEDVQWIGEHRPGIIWPVSKAEKWTMEYRERVARDDAQFQLYMANYNRYLAVASEEAPADRGKFIVLARAELQKVRQMMRNNPNFLLFNMGMLDMKAFDEWYAEQEKTLRELGRR